MFTVYLTATNFMLWAGEEYFENGICLIEWGETIEEILPPDYIKVTFYKNDDNEEYRELHIETFGNKLFKL